MVKVSNITVNYVDREEASKILKVSTRTIDRYIRKFQFKVRKDGRLILIRRTDLEKIIEKHIGQFVDINATRNEKELEAKQSAQENTNIQVKDLKVESVRKAEKTEEVYQHLYLETKKELKEKQERLEAATYRVGQLESQVKNMVPLLDFNRKEKELREAKTAIELKEQEKIERLQKMQEEIKTERVAKWIYLFLAGLLLVVEPILFLWWAFS